MERAPIMNHTERSPDWSSDRAPQAEASGDFECRSGKNGGFDTSVPSFVEDHGNHGSHGDPAPAVDGSGATDEGDADTRCAARDHQEGGDVESAPRGPGLGDDCPYPIEFSVDEWDQETGELVGSGIELAPCGRKGCPVCGPRLRDRYVAHFARIFSDLADDAPVWFLTLTVDAKVLPDDAGELEARKYLVHSWDKYMKRLRRRSESISYAGSFELHSSGDRWHLHVLVSATFPDYGSDGAAREMMRIQWFEAGGGAVGKVKRIREGYTERSDDGTPDGIEGAVGYVVKYAFKDAATSMEEQDSRRSLIASQGIGYHSAEAKERRREKVEEAEDEADGEGDPPHLDLSRISHRKCGVEEEWRPLVEGGGGRRRRADTLTEEDRERFEGYDEEVRTVKYREKVEDGASLDGFGSDWRGETVWTVWELDREAESIHRTVYDRWPDAEGSRVISSRTRVNSLSTA